MSSMNYAAYFDASGKERGFDFLTVAGASSPIKKWRRFEREWNEILRREGVSEFHATDFAASKCEYKGWKGQKERRSRFLRDLIAVAKRNVNRLFTVTIDLPVWRSVNSSYLLEETFYSPYSLAGFSVMNQTMEWARKKRIRPNMLQIVFEDGDEGWDGLQSLCGKYSGGFEPIRLPKEQALPFQFGDMLAWKSRIAATNSLSRLKRMQSHGPSVESDFKEIEEEIKSLDRLMIRPGHKSIYSQRALVQTCDYFKIAKRKTVDS